MSTKPKLLQRGGSPAHALLVEKAQQARKCLTSLLNEGSRDWELIEQFQREYQSFMSAADLVSGQVDLDALAAEVAQRKRDLTDINFVFSVRG